jgi:chemotaxis protein methyltransferase CheR
MTDPDPHNHETYFFRHVEQLNQIVGWLCQRGEKRGLSSIQFGDSGSARLPQRIWSAGCSLGAEPYSLAMLVDMRRETRLDHPLTIWATDVDETCLAQAREASFPAWYLRHCPDVTRQRYFDWDGTSARLDRRIAGQVEFYHHDLDSGTKLGGTWDVILCRNVLMYYDRARQRRMLQYLVDQLRGGGLLAVGIAEGVCLAEHPDLVRLPDGLSVFRKQPQVPAPARRAPAALPAKQLPSASTLSADHQAIAELRAATRHAEDDQPELARRALKRCLYLAPWMSAAHLQLGMLERSQGRPKQAQRSFRNALQLAQAAPPEQPSRGFEQWTNKEVADMATRMLKLTQYV